MNSNDRVDDGTNQRKTNRGVNFECFNAKVVVMNINLRVQSLNDGC